MWIKNKKIWINYKIWKLTTKTIKNFLKENLKSLALRLESVSIDSVLKRGFAWVSDSKFQTIYDTNSAKRAQSLHIRFADGIVKSRVTERDCAVQGDLFDDL